MGRAFIWRENLPWSFNKIQYIKEKKTVKCIAESIVLLYYKCEVALDRTNKLNKSEFVM